MDIEEERLKAENEYLEALRKAHNSYTKAQHRALRIYNKAVRAIDQEVTNGD